MMSHSRSSQDIPGLRVYVLLFKKAYPRLKDFFIFFMLLIFFLSISIWFVFKSSGGNPDFRTLSQSFGSVVALTFGAYNNDFENGGIGTANSNQVVIAIQWMIIILLQVIALNILLAIIVDAYNFAEEDEDLTKESKSMLEPTFLTNYVSLMYFLFSVPFDALVFPLYKRLMCLHGGKVSPSMRTYSSLNNKNKSLYSSGMMGTADEEDDSDDDSGNEGPVSYRPGDVAGLMEMLDRNGDGAINWEDRGKSLLWRRASIAHVVFLSLRSSESYLWNRRVRGFQSFHLRASAHYIAYQALIIRFCYLHSATPLPPSQSSRRTSSTPPQPRPSSTPSLTTSSRTT